MERPDGRVRLQHFVGFEALLRELGDEALILVDMPIGLPDRIRGYGRTADQMVRPLLGARRGSVFAVPARAAVEAGGGPFADTAVRRLAHRESCRLARLHSDPPRAVSIQSFALFPRILEIDRLLRAEAALASRVLESHPELVFTQLAGTPPRFSKRTAEGAAERRALLLAHGLAPALLEAPRPPGVAEDDRLDACALLLAARRAALGAIRRFPEPPEHDAHGIPITIHA